MTDPTTPRPPDAAQALRAELRAELVAAMKERDRDAVSALRTLVAAIDNAEAVAPGGDDAPGGSPHVAGARAGVGSTEAARRELAPRELRRIVDGEVAERRGEADRYDALGRPDEAESLRRQAAVLATWVERLPDP